MVSRATTEHVTTNPWWWEAAPRQSGLDDSLPHCVDVAIVGSGYTGLSAARTLAQAGLDVVVLESDALGEGASSRNAGFVGRSLLGGVYPNGGVTRSGTSRESISWRGGGL